MQILVSCSVNMSKPPQTCCPAAMDPTLACLLLLLSPSSAKYVRVMQRTDWSEAQNHCREHHTDLAAISNRQDAERLQQLAREAGDYLWIGMERRSTAGGRWMWSGGAEVSQFFWAPNQPDNRLNERYSVIQELGCHDARAQYVLPFICFRVEVVRQRKTWEEALLHCREEHQDLASVTSDTEMLLIQGQLERHGTTEHVWVGLHFFPDGWRWVDGQPLEYEAWGQETKPACPPLSRSCAALRVLGGAAAGTAAGAEASSAGEGGSEHEWEAHDCEDRLHFLCY